MKLVVPQKAFSDDRGKIETISVGREWREVSRFTSKPGKKRGNHYHKDTQEMLFVVEGEIEIECEHIKTGQIQKQLVSKGQGILIEPYERHTVDILAPTVWISFLSKEYDSTSPDVH